MFNFILALVAVIATVGAPLTANAETGIAAKDLLVGAPIQAPLKPACDDGDGPVRFAERVAGRIWACERKFGRNTPQDINCYDQHSPIDWVRPAGLRDDLNRMAEQMFFQELAKNSNDQTNCRLSLYNRYASDETARKALNERAAEELNKVDKDLGITLGAKIRALIEYRQKLSTEQTAWQNAANGAGGGGMGQRENAKLAAQKIAEVNETIYRMALAIPMAHETEVLNAIEKMAMENRFDPAAFQGAMALSAQKYQKASDYFQSKALPSGVAGKIRYCTDDDFKHRAGSTGALRRWVNSMPADSPGETLFKKRLGCKLDAQYESGPANLQTGVMITGFIAGAATLGASVAAEAGVASAVAAGTWLSVSSAGIDAVGLVMASQAIRRDCFSPSYLLSADRNTCDPQKDFQHEVVDRDLSSCAINGIMTAAAVPLHILAYLRLRKVAAAVEVVSGDARPLLKPIGRERMRVEALDGGEVRPTQFAESKLKPGQRVTVPASRHMVSIERPDGTTLKIRITVPAKANGTPNTKLLDKVVDSLSRMPEGSLDDLRTIVVNPRASVQEGDWRDGETAASAARGRISLFPRGYDLVPSKRMASTMRHELGHIVAEAKFGSATPDAKWLKAIESDGVKVSTYGETSTAEDFAEAMRVYMDTDGGVTNPAALQRFAGRFKILDEIMATDVQMRARIMSELKKRSRARGISWALAAGGAGGASLAILRDGDQISIVDTGP